MKNSMRTLPSLAVLIAATALGWLAPHPQDPPGLQDPKKVVKPPGAETKPSEKPAKKAIGKPDKHAIEGVYRLRKRVVNGVASTKPSSGYLAITTRHLFLNLMTPGTKPNLPLVHSAVREWRQERGELRTTAKLDYFTDSFGKIHIAPEGHQEARSVLLTLGGVRIIQGRHSYLEFERVE